MNLPSAWMWSAAIAVSVTIACAHDAQSPSAPGNGSSTGASSFADPTDSLANPPALDDSAKGHEADVGAALAIARAKLKTLDRYHHWEAEHEHYDSHIAIDASHHVVIMFAPPLVTDSDVTIEVDPATKTIVAIRQGAA